MTIKRVAKLEIFLTASCGEKEDGKKKPGSWFHIDLLNHSIDGPSLFTL